MAKLDVLTYPNRRLKQKSKPLKDVPNSIRDLAKNMFETLYSYDNGIGLAAPQVGELIRLLIIDVPKKDPIDPEKLRPDPLCLINPKIIEKSGDTQYDEGCLSCPDLIITVDRHAKIRIGYWDLEGKPRELTLTGLKSICVQHEIDHLNGTLLVDRVSPLERDLYRNQRIKIAKSEKDLVNIL